MSKGKKGQPSQDYLEPIKSKKKRKKFLVYDVESKSGDSQDAGFTRPFLVGLLDPSQINKKDEGYQEFRDEPHLVSRPWERRHISPGGCIDKLLTVILQKQYSGYVIYAHNGGNFDHLFLLTWLQEKREEFGFELIPVQSSIQIIRVWRIPEDPEEPIKERWEFLDSMKLLPFGLEKACKTFGLPGKVSHDLNMHEDDPRWSLYLKQDCLALAAVMAKFYNMVENLGGEVGITTPSTALKLFRRRYLGQDGTPDKIPRHAHWKGCDGRENGTCNGCAHDWIRLGYYGGRTEIHRMHGEKLNYYDINSSYVASMRYDMPIGDRIVEDGGLDNKTIRWWRHRSPKNKKGNYSGFCECTVFIPPECPIPPLPHRSRETGKLIFPTGLFHGVWSLEELALLDDPLVNGRIEFVRKTVWFRLKPMFMSMVDELWKLRDPKREGFDEGLSALAKLLGNGSYGKFAMKQDRTSVVFSKDDNDEKCFLCGDSVEPKQGLCINCLGSKPAMTEPDGDVWYQAHHVDAPYIIPHVASHITALSRVCLWNVMRMVITTQTDNLEKPSLGNVVFINDKPAVVKNINSKYASIQYLDDINNVEDILVKPVNVGGKIFYLDTDSCITDVKLSTSTLLGALKDEYPDEQLRYLAVQPKVYLIEKMIHNDAVARRKYILNESNKGNDSFDASTIDTDSIKEAGKVTMKGFPPRMRTKANLTKLRGGESLEWEQLEKVRTLARTGFRRPPRMRAGDTAVNKAFRSSYDKRIVLEDGSTKAIVLNEPYQEFSEAAE